MLFIVVACQSEELETDITGTKTTTTTFLQITPPVDANEEISAFRLTIGDSIIFRKHLVRLLGIQADGAVLFEVDGVAGTAQSSKIESVINGLIFVVEDIEYMQPIEKYVRFRVAPLKLGFNEYLLDSSNPIEIKKTLIEFLDSDSFGGAELKVGKDRVKILKGATRISSDLEITNKKQFYSDYKAGRAVILKIVPVDKLGSFK